MTAPSEQRSEARLFEVGALCFALGALASLTDLTRPVGLPGPTPAAVTFVVGSLFFTVAAFVQWRLTGRWRRGRWRSATASDWWSAAVQFAGTLCFNVSTAAAVDEALRTATITTTNTARPDRLVWAPDLAGSACFLCSSVLAVHATTVRDRLWDPAARTWKSAWFNLVGSLAFGVAAVAGYVEPGTGRDADAAVVAGGTLVGALCFLVGAWLMAPARVSGSEAAGKKAGGPPHRPG